MIDLNVLLEFCGGDENLAQNFIAMFKTEAQEASGQLDQYLANKQYDELSNTAHKLKSHFNYLGASALAQIAYAVETQSRNEEEDQLSDSVRQLKSRLDDLLAKV